MSSRISIFVRGLAKQTTSAYPFITYLVVHMVETKVEGVFESNPDQDPVIRGANVSGRAWKVSKGAFRVASRSIKNKKLTSWELKAKKRAEDKQFKQKVKELKTEKEQERQNKKQALKERREKKEETERYERLALKMHAKKVERMRRREKRNKALKER